MFKLSYVEAHQIQTKIAKMVASEKTTWDSNRKIKMDTLLTTLKNRHHTEMEALKLKINNSRQERIK